MKRLVTSFAACLLALSGGISAAPAADLVKVRAGPVKVLSPTVCRHRDVLDRISEKFDYQVRHVPHLPQVSIDGFRHVKERRHLPRRDDRPIERRYCKAVVDLSDGRSRDVWYLIEGASGSASLGSNLEFCVEGFDRWHVYGGRCRSLR